MSKKEIEIVPLRELSYADAKKEIIEYAQNAGKKKVYVSEIVEKLRLDIELVAEILYKWRDCKCEQLWSSYTCPVMSCQYNNYTQSNKMPDNVCNYRVCVNYYCSI